MFAELVTEAGPLKMPRAEARMADKKDHYIFDFTLPFGIAPNTMLYARVHVTRDGDSCFGVAPILGDQHEGMRAGTEVRLGPWYIHIPQANVVENPA
jgi:hypothetical protein